jgi:Family of unknown function (DUF5755)
MKRNGLICIETLSIFLILICILTIIYVVSKTNQTINITQDQKNSYPNQNAGAFYGIPNYPYNNLPGDVLLNPYVPPLNNERYIVPQVQYIPPNTVPINISTSIGAVETSYRQVGILNSSRNVDGRVVPLMGRPLYVNRDKWQYYTISNQHNNVKLPIIVQGRDALRDQGVNQLYTGDLVYVEGYNEYFRVKIYETDTIKYIPYI